MGNTVSAHICRFKVFRPYPVILYRLRLDPSIYWWKKLVSLGIDSDFGPLYLLVEKIGVPRMNDQIWRTRW